MTTITPTPATDLLRPMLPAGTRVLVLVTNVNSAGTSRQMAVVATVGGYPTEITALVAQALKRRMGKYGVIMSGGGMDMRFALLYELAQVLHGDGYSLSLA